MKYLNTGVDYNLVKVGSNAEKLGFYSVDSEVTETKTMYVLGDDEVAIINSGGAIRITLEDALELCEELPQIIKDFNTYARLYRAENSMRRLFPKSKRKEAKDE